MLMIHEIIIVNDSVNKKGNEERDERKMENMKKKERFSSMPVLNVSEHKTTVENKIIKIKRNKRKKTAKPAIM